MQLAICEKAVDAVWSFYDTENKGYISKSQGEELAKACLEKVGKGDLFNQTAFDLAFDKLDELDGNKDGKVDKSLAV